MCVSFAGVPLLFSFLPGPGYSAESQCQWDASGGPSESTGPGTFINLTRAPTLAILKKAPSSGTNLAPFSSSGFSGITQTWPRMWLVHFPAANQ